MLRYYAIATVIVLGIAVLATAHVGDWMHFHFRSSNRPQPPQHVNLGNAGSAPTGGLLGDAPWALSALPDCFIQRDEWTGSATYVEAHIPRSAQPVAPGSHLQFGPCTIFVRDGELLVGRGADRLRVPPHAVLYRDGSSLLLLRTAGKSSILRSYAITATP